MHFLCLCYYDAERFAALSPAQLEAIGPACRPHDAALRATGKLRVQGSLALPEAWRTVRPRGGGPSIAHGPHTRSALQAGAFFIVEAHDMDEALSVATKHAAAHVGEDLGFAVEVRACDTIEWSPPAA